MGKKSSQINRIKYGELHLFYPFKICNELSFREQCKMVYDNDICFKEKYKQTILDSMGSSLAISVKEFQDQAEKMQNGMRPFSVIVKDPITKKVYSALDEYISDYKINGENSRVEITSSDNSISLNVVSRELESLQNRIFRIQDELDFANSIYGRAFVDNHERILLLPFKAKLSNNKCVWINAVLYLFKNKMGILKIELPLVDVDIEPLKQNKIDLLVQSIENCWRGEAEEKGIILSALYDYYLKKLFADKTIEPMSRYELRNTLLVDFDEMPKQINDIPKGIQEDLFRIISAPVPAYSFTSYQKDAVEHIANNCWVTHGLKYIVKTNGGVLSLIDRGVFDYYSEGYSNSLNSELKTIAYENMCSRIASTINSNVECALIIILLKKINESLDYLNPETQSLMDLRKEYSENVIFINKLQSSCYGSVMEQIEQMEKMMPYYINTKMGISNREAINTILADKEQQRKGKRDSLIAFAGLVLSMVFGLPAIFESLSIIREMLRAIIEFDIPVISLNNTSVVLWLILIISILAKLFTNKYLNK